MKINWPEIGIILVLWGIALTITLGIYAAVVDNRADKLDSESVDVMVLCEGAIVVSSDDLDECMRAVDGYQRQGWAVTDYDDNSKPRGLFTGNQIARTHVVTMTVKD